MRIKDSAIKEAADWLENEHDWFLYRCDPPPPDTLAEAKRDGGFSQFAKAIRMAVRLSKPKPKEKK